MTLDLSLIGAATRQYGAAEAEYRFHPVRRWRFDLAWPALKVAFEREGATWTGGRHTRAAGYSRDCAKYNAAQLAGWVVIRGTADTIRDGSALVDLLAALALRSQPEVAP